MLRGAGLIDEQARYNIALRDRTVCASQPGLRGFDVVALHPASHTDRFTVEFRAGEVVAFYDTPRS